MTILRIKIAYQRFPRLKFDIHAHVGMCLPIREILRGAVELRAINRLARNAARPGDERAAKCKEGCWRGASLCLTVNWLSKISCAEFVVHAPVGTCVR